MKLDERIKELIAIGASVTANCQPCLQYHVDKAMENGAAEQEVKEAIEVAKMVRKGATAKTDKFAEGIAPSAVGRGAVKREGCGCSS